VFVVLAALMALPGLVYAQSAITGIVRDTSGGVLPGVTVEASSPALIEGTRTVYTDGAGLYRIENLRPGDYVVVFTLPGFQTLRREGLSLPSEFVATVNVEMRVGALEESITITADAGVVDVTSAVHTQVLNREAMDSIPTGRTIQGMGQLIVGISLSLPDTGGARSMQQTYMSTHGMTAANNTVMVDGMMVNGLQGDGAIQSYFNDAMNQEVSYQTSGIGAETSAGGVRLNMIPREGGNRFSGDFNAAYRPGDWQADNLTQRHQDKGLRTGNSTDRIVDFTVAQGGPIKQDKLWFFASARYISANNFIPDTFFDDGSPGLDDQYIKSALVRLTWQISQKNKLSAYFDEIDKYRGHDMQSLEDPETAALQWFSPAYSTAAAKLTSTVTSRLLLEGGYSRNLEYYTNSYRPDIEQPRFSPAWFAGASRIERLLGGRTAAATSQTTQSPERHAVNATATYVTGSHSIKGGVQLTWGDFYHSVDANADLTQQYQSPSLAQAYTVPHSVIIRNTPLQRYGERLNRDLGFFIQDSWTIRRLTVNAGVRYEMLKAQVLAATTPAGRFVPERSFPAIEGLPDWKNWAPRFSLVYDLFGNARTALKYSINRYNQARTTGVASPFNLLVSQTSSAVSPLPWTDLNGDDIADGFRGCVYLTPGCEINFATLPASFGIAAENTYGGFPRTYNLEHALELQHELLPRLSVGVSWFRGNFKNLTNTVDRALDRDADFIPVTVFNPLDGQPFTIYRTAPGAIGRATDSVSFVDDSVEQIYNSVGFEFRARIGNGGQVFGGVGVARELNVDCNQPDNPNNDRFCDDRENDIPYKTSFKLAGSYPLVWGLTLSGSFRSEAGTDRGSDANGSTAYTVTRGVTTYPADCPAPCPAGAVILPTANWHTATATLKLVPFGQLFNERIHQLDLKLTKSFRLNRVTISPVLEIFNAYNADSVVTYVSTTLNNASYERPNSIVQGRMIGIGTTVRW